MLANHGKPSLQVGRLSQDVHKPSAFFHQLIEFIAFQLPVWRDRADRKVEAAETVLTSQICAHLNSAARLAVGWDILQFRVEERDTHVKGRKIDLVASPSGTRITIEGRTYVDFDTLMPLECKRLPTPRGSDRDEREYVITREGTTGGIQRFKQGDHGADHLVGAIIGYLQQDKATDWNSRVSGWIGDLAGVLPGWSMDDHLKLERTDVSSRLTILRSCHARQAGLEDIELRHLWIEMN